MAVLKHQVITDISRPSKDLIALVAPQHVGVAGAEAGPRQTMHPDIKPLDPSWRVCGPAFTIKPEMWFDRMMSEIAPKYIKPGDVVVIDAAGRTEIAVWGMTMSKSAKAAGAAGVVIDGSTMNSDLLVEKNPQLPIFSRGVAATATVSEWPGSINVPVNCGGVVVFPGDIILGDRDGVVVIKPELAKQIVDNIQSHNAPALPPGMTRDDVRFQNLSEKLQTFGSIQWPPGEAPWD